MKLTKTASETLHRSAELYWTASVSACLVETLPFGENGLHESWGCTAARGLGVSAHCGQVGNRPGLTVVSVMRTVQVKPPSGDASPQQTALDDCFRSLPTGTILF